MAAGARDTSLLAGFRTAPFTYGETTHDVHRIGEGPAVIVIHEVPGVTPPVIEFARRVAGRGFTVFMPSLFGIDGKPRTQAYTMTSMIRACVSREFTCLATKKASPVTDWLRGLARAAHDELGGPGVGAIGMCLTGGFALAMMVDDSIAAPVLSQPATPFPFGAERKRSLSISDEDLARVRERVDAGCPVMGLRFTQDPAVPEERFATLRRALGDGFIAIEIDSSPGNEFGIKRSAHSVLTEELVDEPGHPTRAALHQVLDFLGSRLRP